ncbi:hypothetical protein ZYGR_0AK03290 [Zygosaccharomyces rouxii]|uniref:Aminodeoxychorismate lyase n=1 Tax=Zygosaccharomyces rouxii TaxID=4956 RepID=A0A1Q3ADM6_ZYGRO|nr:hypothetical protein ZYGR_0AK03290 [Zygosaccharomyces rouxii]
MGIKRNNGSKKELSVSERRILDTIQQDIIERYFEPALGTGEFEILSTLRYDPSFTHLFPEQHYQHLGQSQNDQEAARLNEIDARLQTIDYNDNNLFALPEESDNGNFEEYIGGIDDNSSTAGDISLMSLMNECMGTQGSSPPETTLPSSTLSEEELYPIFYQRFLLLGEHFKRLNLSLEFFKWGFQVPIDLLLENLVRAIPDHHEVENIQEKMRLLIDVRSCYKMRILIRDNGKMRVEAHPIPLPSPSASPTNLTFSTTQYFISNILGGFIPNTPSTWDVFVDTEPTKISPFTTFKTTYRQPYSVARQRMTQLAEKYGTNKKCEILVYNDTFQLMEGSISSVAIIRYKEDDPTQFRFITPALASGCLCGTMRRYLLKKGLVDEHPIDVRDLFDGEQVILLNGVMGCVKGTIRQSYRKPT